MLVLRGTVSKPSTTDMRSEPVSLLMGGSTNGVLKCPLVMVTHLVVTATHIS
jgi:hypothetical protein